MMNFLILLLFTSFRTFAFEKDSLKQVISDLAEIQRSLDLTNELVPPCISKIEQDNFLISDSLVKNLSCKNLNYDNVLLSLQDDAFSVDRQFPMSNWSSGALGQCWGLAFSQRRLFYLSRFSNKEELPALPDETRKKMLEMFSLKKPEEIIKIDSKILTDARTTTIAKSLAFVTDFYKNNLSKEIYEESLRENEFYAIYPTSFHYYSSELINKLHEKKDGKDFESVIESLQRSLFFRIGNTNLVAGEVVRSNSDNKKTMEELLKNTSRGRMPIVVVRSKITAQHAVLVKRIQKISDKELRLFCYDSNVPGREVVIDYNDESFSTNAMVSNNIVNDTVGLFIKDEEDMDYIQNTVYKYYKNLCKKIKSPNL